MNEARRDRSRRATSQFVAARHRVECGDLPFLVQRDGTWLYRGSPIRRKELVCLFSSVLKRMDDGSFWLETPAERGRIEVEDTPWIAGELDWSGHGRDQVLSFRTNVDQVVTAGPEHLIRVSHDWLTSEPRPYIAIRPGAPGGPPLEARISRAVYYELVALAVPHCVCGVQKLGVWSDRRFFPLGDLPGDNASTERCQSETYPGEAYHSETYPNEAGEAGDAD